MAQAASLFFRRNAVPWRQVFVCGAIIVTAAIPGLTYVFRASPENLYFAWMPHTTAKEIWHLAMFFGGSGAKVAFALALWIAGIVAIFRNRRATDSDTFWRGTLLVLWAILPPAILALLSLLEPMFLQRYMVFSLPGAILLAAAGAESLRRWRIGVLLVIVLCVVSVPTIVKQYEKPREDWRNATGTVLSSAIPGDAVVFFPFYSRIMFDYYRDRFGAAPELHVYAPGYYSGGEDDRALLATLDRDPQQFQHVWVFVAGRDERLRDFDRGMALGERLQALYGEPEEHRFAGVAVLRFGR
jgi:mannosyltransferase